MMGKRELILLVDDEVDVRQLMADVLEAEGYEVLQAADGIQALALLATSRQPRLIITDLTMPGMDGWALCARLESHPVLRLIPVVLLSGADRQSFSGLIAKDHLQKPADLTAMLATIARHVAPVPASGRLHVRAAASAGRSSAEAAVPL